MNPKATRQYVTVAFSLEDYAYLKECAKATYGQDRMIDVRTMIERAMPTFSKAFIADLVEDKAGEEKAA